MVPLVFKASVGLIRSRVGSIPIRLRHFCSARVPRTRPVQKRGETRRHTLHAIRYFMDVVLTMAKKTKIIVFCLLILLGTALLGYGAFVHSADVWPEKEEDGSAVMAKSEPALIKEASIGGVTRDESGKIKQTYTGKPPEECAT